MLGSERERLVLLVAVALLLVGARPAPGGAAPAGDDPAAARLSAAEDATEYWGLTAELESGYRLFVRFGITNEGPGEQTAGAIWYVMHPDGRVTELRNGRAQGNWKLSADHLRLDVASSTLDLHAPVRRLAIDTTSQGAKIDLRFPAGELPADARPSSAGKFQSEVLQLSAPVEGSLWVRGMAAPVTVHGTMAVTHAWMDESIADLLQRLLEFVGSTPDVAVYLSDVTTPAGARRRQLVVQHGDTFDYGPGDFDMVIDSGKPTMASHKYPLPARVEIRTDRAVLEVNAARPLVRTDPMEKVPQPFRLLFSLKIEPRWIWTDASFHLQLSQAGESPPFQAEGQGILSVSYMNPMRSK